MQMLLVFAVLLGLIQVLKAFYTVQCVTQHDISSLCSNPVQVEF